MKYFICGFSGAGKSTLLKKIKESGEYKDYLFVDLDQLILSQNDGFNSLGDLIESKGWEWFRAAERDTLKNLLASSNIWISLGGGTMTLELANELKSRKDVKGYWLDTDFDTCWQRIQSDKNRPLVKEGRDHLKHLYDERWELYNFFDRLNLKS